MVERQYAFRLPPIDLFCFEYSTLRDDFYDLLFRPVDRRIFRHPARRKSRGAKPRQEIPKPLLRVLAPRHAIPSVFRLEPHDMGRLVFSLPRFSDDRYGIHVRANRGGGLPQRTQTRNPRPSSLDPYPRWSPCAKIGTPSFRSPGSSNRRLPGKIRFSRGLRTPLGLPHH